MSDHDPDPVDPIDEEETDLADAEEEAGFDLGIDVAQPQAPYGNESFDIANDLGYGNGPKDA